MVPDAPEVCVARYYDPATGQFLSLDPDVELTEAPFSYGNDDAVNEVDPAGLGICWSVHCLSSDVSHAVGLVAGVAGIVALVTSWIPVVDAITAGVAVGLNGVVVIADIVECLSGPCDAVGLALDLLSLIPGVASIKLSREATAIADTVETLKAEGQSGKAIAILESKAQNKDLLAKLLGAKSSSIGAGAGTFAGLTTIPLPKPTLIPKCP